MGRIRIRVTVGVIDGVCGVVRKKYCQKKYWYWYWQYFSQVLLTTLKINAFSFLAPTTFGAEYCLNHAITHHPPCSAVSLRQLSYLLVDVKETSL